MAKKKSSSRARATAARKRATKDSQARIDRAVKSTAGGRVARKKTPTHVQNQALNRAALESVRAKRSGNPKPYSAKGALAMAREHKAFEADRRRVGYKKKPRKKK